MARILFIDDDPDTRELVYELLKSAGHEVALAADGREGVLQYSQKPADLVITDIYMPTQKGVETIHELRTLWPQLAIIAMSGRADAMLSIAQKLGATAVLRKPFTANELLAEVKTALERVPPSH